MNIEKNPLVVFVHIMKTGGTTLRVKHLVKQYQTNQEWLYLEQPEKLIEEALKENTKYICGHFGYGLYGCKKNYKIYLKESFPRPLIYITMIRNPVDRIISLYYDIQRKFPNSPIKNMSLKEFVDIKNDFYEDNHQTLMISGGSTDLNLAKSRVLNDFKVVGITDLFNESVFLMKKELGWGEIPLQTSKGNLNVNANRKRTDEIPREIINYIESKNLLDMELYQFAKDHLKKRFKSIKPHI